MGKLNIEDLPLDLQKKVKKENGVSTRKQSLSKNQVRTLAISVLNVIKDLTPAQRTRVLLQAAKVNRV